MIIHQSVVHDLDNLSQSRPIKLLSPDTNYRLVSMKADVKEQRSLVALVPVDRAYVVTSLLELSHVANDERTSIMACEFADRQKGVSFPAILQQIERIWAFDHKDSSI